MAKNVLLPLFWILKRYNTISLFLNNLIVEIKEPFKYRTVRKNVPEEN